MLNYVSYRKLNVPSTIVNALSLLNRQKTDNKTKIIIFSSPRADNRLHLVPQYLLTHFFRRLIFTNHKFSLPPQSSAIILERYNFPISYRAGVYSHPTRSAVIFRDRRSTQTMRASLFSSCCVSFSLLRHLSYFLLVSLVKQSPRKPIRRKDRLDC